MLSIEQIENIIKSKYKKVKLTGEMFEFCHKEDKSKCCYGHKELILCSEENKLIYNQKIIDMDGICDCEKITIENNAIELKHYLDIKITQQDIIDWLETFTTKYNERYLIPARECWTFYVYTSLTDIDGKKSKCFGLMATQYTEDIIILQAKNSNEYWRLYNIIKNLKE